MPIGCLFCTIFRVGDKLDPRIKAWKGGRLRIFAPTLEMKPTGEKTPDGRSLDERELLMKLDQEAEAKPFGRGLALLQPSMIEVLPGVMVEIDVRRGRLQAVAIRSEENGPELTQTVLRKIGSPRNVIREHAPHVLVRLAVDDKGEIYGVYSFAPEHAWDFRIFEELTADIQADVDQTTRKRGRPPLPDEELEEVARVVREARVQRERTDEAVARRFGITWGAAKKRIRIARDRGFLNEEEESDG
jgi:hypothetical protein